MPEMTQIEGVPDSEVAKPGMAHFAGSGPNGKTCGDCKFRGYSRQSKTERWSESTQRFVQRNYRVSSCLKFKSMTGAHGTPVEKHYDACKYFEQAPKD